MGTGAGSGGTSYFHGGEIDLCCTLSDQLTFAFTVVEEIIVGDSDGSDWSPGNLGLPGIKRKERIALGLDGEKVLSPEYYGSSKGGSILELFKASGRFGQASESIGVFGWLRKAVFYQRTAGSSSTKEPQDSPRESQCVKRIFRLERRCN
jgi:hypothetical protein